MPQVTDDLDGWMEAMTLSLNRWAAGLHEGERPPVVVVIDSISESPDGITLTEYKTAPPTQPFAPTAFPSWLQEILDAAPLPRPSLPTWPLWGYDYFSTRKIYEASRTPSEAVDLAVLAGNLEKEFPGLPRARITAEGGFSEEH